MSTEVKSTDLPIYLSKKKSLLLSTFEKFLESHIENQRLWIFRNLEDIFSIFKSECEESDVPPYKLFLERYPKLKGIQINTLTHLIRILDIINETVSTSDNRDFLELLPYILHYPLSKMPREVINILVVLSSKSKCDFFKEYEDVFQEKDDAVIELLLIRLKMVSYIKDKTSTSIFTQCEPMVEDSFFATLSCGDEEFNTLCSDFMKHVSKLKEQRGASKVFEQFLCSAASQFISIFYSEEVFTYYKNEILSMNSDNHASMPLDIPKTYACIYKYDSKLEILRIYAKRKLIYLALSKSIDGKFIYEVNETLPQEDKIDFEYEFLALTPDKRLVCLQTITSILNNGVLSPLYIKALLPTIRTCITDQGMLFMKDGETTLSDILDTLSMLVSNMRVSEKTPPHKFEEEINLKVEKPISVDLNEKEEGLIFIEHMKSEETEKPNSIMKKLLERFSLRPKEEKKLDFGPSPFSLKDNSHVYSTVLQLLDLISSSEYEILYHEFLKNLKSKEKFWEVFDGDFRKHILQTLCNKVSRYNWRYRFDLLEYLDGKVSVRTLKELFLKDRVVEIRNRAKYLLNRKLNKEDFV